MWWDVVPPTNTLALHTCAQRIALLVTEASQHHPNVRPPLPMQICPTTHAACAGGEGRSSLAEALLAATPTTLMMGCLCPTTHAACAGEEGRNSLAEALLAAAPTLPRPLMMGCACAIFLSACRAILSCMANFKES